MIGRREFITLLGGAVAWPMAARAQQGERVRRIGVLLPAAADDLQYQTWVGAFLQGLGQAGWLMGRNVRGTCAACYRAIFNTTMTAERIFRLARTVRGPVPYSLPRLEVLSPSRK
jgi:hypothetical protein